MTKRIFYQFITTIILSVFFLSCHNKNISFEKEFYERITGIKLPVTYKVVESFDNREWLTGTLFKVDSVALRELVIQNKFTAAQNINQLKLLSLSYLQEYKPKFTDIENIYVIHKGNGKNDWKCIVDLNTNLLCIEITYPDHAGN